MNAAVQTKLRAGESNLIYALKSQSISGLDW